MSEKNARPATAESDKDWQKTQYSNLIRYVPSGTYYARLRVKGKLIRRSLKTDVLSVAKLRFSDFEKNERQGAENRDSVSAGRLNMSDAIAIHKKRTAGDASLKPRTKVYHDERIAALLKSWPELATKEIRTITKTDCLDWAAKFGVDRSPTVFNHTISILRKLFEIGIELGARYDNPARFIKRVSERPKRLTLPEPETFGQFIAAVENELEANFESEVESRHVGEMVMQHLRDLDEVAYVRFASVYRQFKDVQDFVEELRPMLAEAKEQGLGIRD